jgi:DNA-binding transcriptional LysR family regulator
MDLTWLEDFQALADTGNFSRAADRRHVTQPAFSRRIRALEDWVGAPLFDRGAQPVALTDAGRALQPAAGNALHQVFMAREAARTADRRRGGTLRFAATHVLSFTFFPAWLRGIEAGVPFAAVQLMSDSLAACQHLMLQEQAQFLLCHHHDAAPGRMATGDFLSVVVGEDVLCEVTAPGATSDHLGYSTDSGLGRIVAAARPGAQTPAFTAHLAAALKTMALAGGGTAWLPRSLILDELADGRLIQGPGAAPEIPVAVCLFRPQADQGAAAEAFWTRVVQRPC